jgi:hypothetical protein
VRQVGNLSDVLVVLIMFLLCILSAASAVTLKHNLSDVYGAPNETFFLDLAYYFGGSDLNFTTSLSNLTILDENKFYLLGQSKYTPAHPATPQVMPEQDMPTLACSRKLAKTFDSNLNLVLISYSGTTLYLSAYNGTALIATSSLTITSGLSSAMIVDMTQSADLNYLYLAVQGYSQTNPSLNFYSVSIANPAKPIQLEEIKAPGIYLDWLRLQTSESYMVITAYTDIFLPQQGVLGVIENRVLFQATFLKFLIGTRHPASFAIDIAFIDNSTFVLVDSEANLYKYSIVASLLTLVESIPLAPLEAPRSMFANKGRILIGFSCWVALIDAETLNSITVVETGFNATSVNLQLDNLIGYVNLYSPQASLFLVLDFSKTLDSIIIRRWDLAEHIPTPLSSLAPFLVASDNAGNLVYGRSDNGFLSMLKLQIGTERLVVAADNSSYAATVSAFSRSSPEDKVNATGSVSSTAVFNNSVATLKGRNYDTSPILIDLELFSSQPFPMVLYPDNYFAGPLANYSLTFNSTSYLSITSNSSQKYSDSVETIELVADFISSSERFLLLYNTDHYSILLYNGTLNSTFDLYVAANATVAASSIIAAGYAGGANITYVTSLTSVGQQYRPTSTFCKQLMTYVNYTLMCLDTHKIDLYGFSTGFLGPPISLSAENVTNVGEFNCTGAAFTMNYTDAYLYIADSNLGLLFLDFQVTNSLGQYIAIKFGDATGVIRAFATSDLVYFLRADGGVAIYSIIQLPPVLLRELQGKGPPIRYSSSENILALQYENFTEIIDLYAEAYSASYVQVPTNSNCSIATPNSADLSTVLFINCANATHTAKRTIQGRKQRSSAPIESEIHFSITSKGKAYSNYSAEGTLTASNAAGSSSLEVVIQTQSFIQSISAIGFPKANTTALPYYESASFQLSNIFKGQDIDFTLIINGKMSDGRADPALISPKVEILSAYDLYESLTDISICSSCSLAFATSKTGLFTFDYLKPNSSPVHSRWSDLGSELLSCSNIVASNQPNDGYLGLVLTCGIFGVEYYSSFNQTVITYMGIKTSLDLYDFQLNHGYGGNSVYVPPVNLASHRTQGNTTILITLSENYDYDLKEYSNNLIIVASCNVTTDVDCDAPQTFSSFELGFESLSVSAADVKAGSQGVALFAADSLFGLRVLNSTNVSEIYPVASIEFNQTLVSLGVCDDWLFLGDAEEGVHKYSITDVFNPVLISSYFKLGNMTGARGNIKCSSQTNPQFAAFPLFSSDGFFTVRILDLLEPSEFSIFADIKCNGTNSSSFPGAFEFLDDSTITIVSSNNKRDYKISPSMLQYPPMSKQQYQDMLGKWSTNQFSLSINVSSEGQVVRTSQFYLQREGPFIGKSEEDDRSRCLGLSLLVLVFIFLG